MPGEFKLRGIPRAVTRLRLQGSVLIERYDGDVLVNGQPDPISHRAHQLRGAAHHPPRRPWPSQWARSTSAPPTSWAPPHRADLAQVRQRRRSRHSDLSYASLRPRSPRPSRRHSPGARANPAINRSFRARLTAMATGGLCNNHTLLYAPEAKLTVRPAAGNLGRAATCFSRVTVGADASWCRRSQRSWPREDRTPGDGAVSGQSSATTSRPSWADRWEFPPGRPSLSVPSHGTTRATVRVAPPGPPPRGPKGISALTPLST